MVAIPWYFVKIVSRPEVFATAYLVITFLTLFWGLYAGTLIDRYSRKNLFILVNVICGIFIGSVAIYGLQVSYLPDILVLLVFGITIFNYNVHYPNLYAFGQEITEKKNYGKLNSYIEIQGQSTSILAGAFAALLLTGTTNNPIVYKDDYKFKIGKAIALKGHRRYLQHTSNANAGEIFATHLTNVLST